jgi:hypothetical protein
MCETKKTMKERTWCWMHDATSDAEPQEKRATRRDIVSHEFREFTHAINIHHVHGYYHSLLVQVLDSDVSIFAQRLFVPRK